LIGTHQRAGDVCPIQAARVTPPSGQTWPSVIYLDASSCSLSHGVAHDNIWWSDCRRQSFLFSFLLFSLLHNCLFFSISVLILLIFYFIFIHFIEVLFFFLNLILQLQFLICFVFHFNLYSFDFFSIVFLLKFFWLSILSFN